MALDLDDLAWLDEGDKVRTREFVAKSVAAIAEARLPKCHLWEWGCRRRNKEARAAFKATDPPP